VLAAFVGPEAVEVVGLEIAAGEEGREGGRGRRGG